MLRVSLITNIIPRYRTEFYNILFSSNIINLKVFCGRVKELSVASFDEYHPNINYVKSIGPKSEVIGYQFLPYFKILNNSDVIVVDGNPRTISNIIIFLLSKLKPRLKVIIWTTSHSYSAGRLTEYIRLMYTSLYHNIITYTECDVVNLQKFGLKTNRIVSINNGLNQLKIEEVSKYYEIIEENKLKKKFVIVSLARLIKKNRFELVLEAIALAFSELEFIYYIIGDGPELDFLKERSLSLKIIDKIQFLGSMHDEYEIGKFMSVSDVFVHPSSIGLSLMHAYGYGLPVITDDNFLRHGPEICFFSNGINGMTFRANDYVDLSHVLKSLLFDKCLRSSISNNNLLIARNKCNNMLMADSFLKFVTSSDLF